MTRRGTIMLAGICLLALTTIASAAGAAETAEQKTIKRALDPVVVTGEQLKALDGAKIENLRLMAVRDGVLVPIPFQIDKVDPDGKFMVAAGAVPASVRDAADFDDRPEPEKRAARIEKFEDNKRKYGKLIAKGKMSAEDIEKLRAAAYHTEQPGILDYNDELAFMVRDSGARAARSSWPVPDGAELTLRDPISGELGWAYLLYWKTGLPPRASEEDYVQYEPEGDIVETAAMKLDFVDDKPLIVESMFPRRNGDQLPDIADRFKMRIRIKPTPLFCIPLNFDENNIEAFTVGYKDGPVRVLRRNIFWITVAGITLPFVPKADVFFVFYETGLAGPVEVQNPFDPNLLLCSGSVGGGGLDFLRTMHGARVITKGNPTGLVFDGKMSDYENHYVKDHQEWAAVVRDADKSAFILRLIQGERMRQAGVNTMLFHIDDPEEEMRPEEEPGARYTGFGVNLLQVPSGTLTLKFFMYLTADYTDEKLHEYLAVSDTPVVVEVE